MNESIFTNKQEGLEDDITRLVESFIENAPQLMVKAIVSYFIGYFYDPDKAIANPWCIDDVKIVRSDLSDEQAHEVLQAVYYNFDCEIGINWDVLTTWAEELYPSKPTVVLS
ncbi:hypothetical protein HW132_07070 [Brasilonema sp. CT11]|nr:hypothetical protein [Brasilonema sp. CT11]